MILIGMFLTCIFTFVTPLTVYLEMPLLLTLRVLEGLAEVTADFLQLPQQNLIDCRVLHFHASMRCSRFGYRPVSDQECLLLSLLVRQLSRVMMDQASWPLLGVGVGTVIAFPLSSWLCASEMGWPLVFYVFGKRRRVASCIFVCFDDCLIIFRRNRRDLVCIMADFWCKLSRQQLLG